MILGFDPGKDKCGIAIMAENGQIHYHQVIGSDEALSTLKSLLEKFSITLLVMGNQTTAKYWKQQLEAALPQSLAIKMIDERNSTLEARNLYWQMYPPKGLQRLIPEGMRLPPRPIDDLVAILLIERYLATL